MYVMHSKIIKDSHMAIVKKKIIIKNNKTNIVGEFLLLIMMATNLSP